MKNTINSTLIVLAALLFGVTVFGQMSGGSDSPRKGDTSKTVDSNLRSVARINPTSLAMEFSLPLAKYPGRGGNALLVGINYSSKVWQMKSAQTWWYQIASGYKRYVTDNYARFGETSASGWTSTMQPPRLEVESEFYNVHGKPYGDSLDFGESSSFYSDVVNSVGSNPGINEPQPFTVCYVAHADAFGGHCHGWMARRTLDGTFYDVDPTVQTQTPNYVYHVKRLNVIMPDGTSREFMQGNNVIYCGTIQTGCTPNLDGTYLATDGSGLRLEYDHDGPSILHQPDGGRYTFPAETQSINGHFADTYVDANGNKTTFTESYSETTGKFLQKTTDTLGRTIDEPIPHNWITQTQTPGTEEISLPGIGSSTQDYEVKWENLKPLGCETSTDVNCVGENRVFGGALEDQTQKLFYESRFHCQGNLRTDLLANPSDHNDPTNEVLFPITEPGIRACNSLGVERDENGDPELDQSGNPIIIPVRFNPVVLSEVTLPNEQKYTFKYNRFGEISKIIYPSGSYETFSYAAIDPLSTISATHNQMNRGVVERRVYDESDSLQQRWTYQAERTWTYPSTEYKLTTISSTGSNPLGTGAKSVRFVKSSGPTNSMFGFSDPLVGMPYDERTYDENGVLRSRVLTEYATKDEFTWSFTAKRDVRPKRTLSIAFEGTQALATLSETEYDDAGSTDPDYFSHLNVKRKKGYHYVVVDYTTATSSSLNWSAIEAWFPASKLASVSEMDYSYDANYQERGILGLPTESRLLNPQNFADVLAKSQASYDELGTYYTMVDYGTTTGYQAPTGIYAHLRGKPTTKRTWDKDTSSWIETHTQFDNFGNVRKVWDTSGDQTRFLEYEYDPYYKYAYVTKTKAPPPDPTGINGMSVGSEVTQTFDFNTGLPLTVTDANGQVASTEYDLVLRPIKVTPPAGGAISETVYNDGERWVKSRQQIDDQNWAESTTYFDSLGRPVEFRTKDAQGDVFSKVEYDNLGRVKRASNPYRIGETVYWSKPQHDAAGRVVESFAPAPDGQTGVSLGTVQFGISTETNLIGTYQIATDASGRKSRAISGIYGIMRVDEATSIGGTVNQDLGPLENPNQPTSYSYNIKGELTKITQGKPNQLVQYRHFMYDSLGRLIRVRQPEQIPNAAIATSGNPENDSWTSAFSYDIFGNVISMTDAKNATITNEYDKASRPTKRIYSDGTPQVEFFYDGKGLPSVPQFSRGSITKVTSSVSEDRFTSFDNHGRLLTSEQITDGQTYPFEYKYNLSGGLIEETYPSGRVVRNYLNSDGGIGSVTSKPGNGLNEVVASNFDYSATGNIRKMKLGNGLWETAQVNERHQLTQIGLGTTSTNQSIFKVDYEYGELSEDGTSVDPVKNIGMIARTTTTIPTTSFVQTFKYDSINRLKEAKEKTGSQVNWQQTFGYDIFGNRTSFSQTVNGTPLTLTAINHPSIDPANNRFTTWQGYVYDLNGNLIQDAEGRSFTFDGNDKQTVVRNASNQIIGEYFYDGSGARVKKVTNTETTVFVYDAAGALAAEYSTQVETTNPTTSYLTADNLGSPRVITDAAGQLIARRDFMPFGEEIGAGVGARTTNLKYTASGYDNVRKRYTGYEKDTETGLDFAEARMYQNKHGRFTAVDPLMASASPGDPQTFNRYTYTGNNPVNRADPSGLDWCRKGGGNEVIYRSEAGCANGWSSINRQEGTIAGGDWSKESKGTATIGDKVRFNANGTVTLIKKATDAQVAQASGTQVQAGQEQVTSNPAGELGTQISRRGDEPLPQNPEDSIAPVVPCAKLIENCASPTSSGTLDMSQNEGSRVVEGSIRILEACSIFSPCSIAAAIGRFGQGEFSAAGGNLLGAIPGFSLLRRADKAVDIVKASEPVVEGIYQFVSSTGKVYVGQSGNIAVRIQQHLASGKLLPEALNTVKTTKVLGGKTAREIAEQLRIRALGGVTKLANERNPIGKAREYLLNGL